MAMTRKGSRAKRALTAVAAAAAAAAVATAMAFGGIAQAAQAVQPGQAERGAGISRAGQELRARRTAQAAMTAEAEAFAEAARLTSGALGAGQASAVASAVELRFSLGKRGFEYIESFNAGSQGGDAGAGSGLAHGDCSPPVIAASGELCLPFRAAAEALGAFVTYVDAASPQERPQIKCEYRGNLFWLSVDDGAPMGAASEAGASESARANATGAGMSGEGLTHSWQARLIDDSAYVPATAFDACLGTTTSFDAATGSIAVSMADDGSLKSLSGFLGEIVESRVGNSDFQWSIDAPRKSMLVDTSFNGSEAMIYCMAKSATMQVIVEPSDGRTLESVVETRFGASGDNGASSNGYGDDGYYDYYQYDAIRSGIVIPEGGGRASRYYEALIEGYGTIALCRVFVRSGYIYTLEVTAYGEPYADGTEADESLFDEGGEFLRLADSFRLGAFAAGASAMDISKASEGRIKYIRYLDVPDASRLPYGWSVHVPADWFERLSEDDGVFATELGRDDVALRVEVGAYPGAEDDASDGADAAVAFAEGAASLYNPDVCTGLASIVGERNGGNACETEFTLKEGRSGIYRVDRRVYANGLLYYVSLSAPVRQFEARRDEYMAVLDSFETGSDGLSSLRDYAWRRLAQRAKWRLAKEGGAMAVAAGNGYVTQLPGDWLKLQDMGGYWSVSGFGGDCFMHDETGAFIVAQLAHDSDNARGGYYALDGIGSGDDAFAGSDGDAFAGSDGENASMDKGFEAVARATLSALSSLSEAGAYGTGGLDGLLGAGFLDGIDASGGLNASVGRDGTEGASGAAGGDGITMSWTKGKVTGPGAQPGDVRRVLTASCVGVSAHGLGRSRLAAQIILIGTGACSTAEEISKAYIAVSAIPEIYATKARLEEIDGFAHNLVPETGGGAGDADAGGQALDGFDLGDLDLGDLDLGDIDLGDIDLGDLDLSDIALGDLGQSGADSGGAGNGGGQSDDGAVG